MRSLVVDASCLINLLATGRPVEILESLGIELVAPPPLRSEVLYLAGGATPREPVDLAPLEEAGRLRIAPLEGPAVEHLVRCSELLEQADASAVALAAALGLPLASDDARQCRVARELYPRLEIVPTLVLLHDAVQRLRLGHDEQRRLARDVRERANFLPPKRDPRRERFLALLED